MIIEYPSTSPSKHSLTTPFYRYVVFCNRHTSTPWFPSIDSPHDSKYWKVGFVDNGNRSENEKEEKEEKEEKVLDFEKDIHIDERFFFFFNFFSKLIPVLINDEGMLTVEGLFYDPCNGAKV